MPGIHEFSQSAANEFAPRRRAAPRTLLALATAAAAFFVVAGTAQAQDCEGGYRMLKGEIPVACDATAAAAPVVSEPLYTGSINRLEPAAPIEGLPATSMTGQKCFGGYAYRPTADNSYVTMPMACH